MAYQTKAMTSIHGLRLGLQRLTAGANGITAVGKDVLIGAEDIRREVSTAETTGTGLRAFGVSNLDGTSAASTPVYVLDPPIPGLSKVIHFGSTASKIWMRTKNGETIRSSGTSTASGFTAITSSAGGTVSLEALTTAIWLAVSFPSTLSGMSLAATT